jgi:integrase
MSNWTGMVMARPQKSGRVFLYLRIKDANSKWADRATGLEDSPENRKAAQKLLRGVRDRLKAQEVALDGGGGPATVRAWAKRWLDDRERQGLTRISEDRAKLYTHVFPVVGDLLLEDVRPRHLVEVVNRLQADGYAPRTVRNVYFLAKALFRDAQVAELVPLGETPAILTRRQLGKMRDADPRWRASAQFTREELEALISDERVPQDRQVAYALLGLGMMRHGEVAGLRWRAYEALMKPLGRLEVTTSYDDGETKTETPRWMPTHPTLAAMLAEWKLTGWPAKFGHAPGSDDLVLPVVPEGKRKGRKREPGSMRDRHYTWKRAQKDLDALGLRRRRVHDLRRTGITLARGDGADRDILRRGTHAPPRDVMELYTSVEWSKLCAEVAKMQVTRRVGAQVFPFRPQAPGGTPALHTDVERSPGDGAQAGHREASSARK